MTTNLFCCPVCGAPLAAESGSYRCPARHTFDIARRGYVNLLTGKAGKQHGDNKEMIAARRDFLSAGYYAPLSQAVAETVLQHARGGCHILDAGCGECHYTATVARALEASGIHAEILALDISREALSVGGRAHGAIVTAVASLYHLPLADESIDMITEIFSPFCGAEYVRVLRPGGILIMVIPGARHLFGLKQILYRHPYENEVADTALPGFILENERDVAGHIHLKNQQDLWNLFTMTPYFYRTAPADKEKLQQMSSLTTEISFKILTYRKAT